MFSNCRGFTIIEVLVGLTIFAVGMMGVAALQISSINRGAFSGNLSEATTLGISTLEALLARDYSHASLSDSNGNGIGGIDNLDANADHHNDSLGRNGKYSVFWNVSQNDPVSNSKCVKVFVKWMVKGNAQQIKFTGLKAEDGT